MNNQNNIRCKRCNRPLKTSEARLRGYGDVCWKIHLVDQLKQNSLFSMKSVKESSK